METQFKGYCHPSQKRDWERAATLAKRSFSDWARIVLDAAAAKEIAKAAKKSQE